MSAYDAANCPHCEREEDEEVVERAEVVWIRAVRFVLAFEQEPEDS